MQTNSLLLELVQRYLPHEEVIFHGKVKITDFILKPIVVNTPLTAQKMNFPESVELVKTDKRYYFDLRNQLQAQDKFRMIFAPIGIWSFALLIFLLFKNYHLTNHVYLISIVTGILLSLTSYFYTKSYARIMVFDNEWIGEGRATNDGAEVLITGEIPKGGDARFFSIPEVFGSQPVVELIQAMIYRRQGISKTVGRDGFDVRYISKTGN